MLPAASPHIFAVICRLILWPCIVCAPQSSSMRTLRINSSSRITSQLPRLYALAEVSSDDFYVAHFRTMAHSTFSVNAA